MIAQGVIVREVDKMIGLTYIRRKCNLSLAELSAVLGVSRQAISSWENGRKQIPAKRKAEMAEFFGIDLGQVPVALFHALCKGITIPDNV